MLCRDCIVVEQIGEMSERIAETGEEVWPEGRNPRAGYEEIVVGSMYKIDNPVDAFTVSAGGVEIVPAAEVTEEGEITLHWGGQVVGRWSS